MNEVEPTVERVMDVPAGALLPELHDLFQVAIGWTDSHLHQFVADDSRYGTAGTDADDDELDETGVAVRALPDHFSYLYDFGDGWEHEVEVVGPGGERPGVLAGEGACPPEDVGGPHGYAEFRKAYADPNDPGHDQVRTWAGAWDDSFDLATADLLVRQTVGAVPAPVQLLLRLTADGVKLTPGGRLPRSLVRQVQEHYPSWYPLGRPASVEEDLPPLAALRDLLGEVGLLRLRKGVLAPTRAAADDLEAVRRLRSWFGQPYEFVSMLATDALALLASDGPCRPKDMAGRLLGLLGDRWATGQGQQLDETAVTTNLYSLGAALEGLDLVQRSKGTWEAGPSARWLLPRATALAHLWS
jgi:hypothetical protein